ncbi:hypothetical protein [uncultured Parasutterella sp.]|uniref:hypothetical protein n=1 Tax=uncultured Parasutterella sp. TaxID=1263098 RepID=UPI0025931E38|nr:hypothetical protein [uncultured Parasutterella sp.]
MSGNTIPSVCASETLHGEDSTEPLGSSPEILVPSALASEEGASTETEDSEALALAFFDFSFASLGAEEGELEEDTAASAEVGLDFCSIGSSFGRSFPERRFSASN